MNRKPDRRSFLRAAAAAATTVAAASVVGCASAYKNAANEEPIIHVGAANEQTDGLGAEESSSPTMSNGQPALRAITLEADGSPLSAERMKTFHARDLANDPLPQPIVLAVGRSRTELNLDQPIQLSLRLSVPGFGEVYCYADNEGRGYSRPAQIDYVVEAAKTRLYRVTQAYRRLRLSGLADDPEFNKHFVAAARPIRMDNRLARTADAYDSLSHGLHAGERLAINAANLRISRFKKPRDDFKFGTAIPGIESQNPDYQNHLRKLFNFATVSWYTWKSESAPDDDRVDYARMDRGVDWCLKNNITPKNFGYLYMTRGATPDWMRPPESPLAASRASTAPINTMPLTDPEPARPHFNPRWGYDRIKAAYATVIRNTMARYDGRVPYAEIMNEAHDKANLYGLTHGQILDMAKMAFTSARQGSKTVKRQMNHCCLWAEYGKRRNADGSRRWSPWQFVKACFDDKTDYEIIGLQLYYPQNDIFEIDAMLDRFLVFNKPLHITEISCSSEDGLDPQSMRPHTYAPGWHGPWSQSTQADWVQDIYTLIYSKPQFEEIGWWDPSDAPGHFWPFGGLLDKNFQPKPAYHRIQKLQQDWGVAKTTP